jgi:hypothetical protein
MPKGVRKSITIPGLLAATVKQRCREFGHSIFTPYAVELVCYDLRSDAKHSITLEIARDTQPAQDAVDRELVARYRPGQPRKGLLVQMVDRIHRLQSVAAASRHDLPLPPLSAVAFAEVAWAIHRAKGCRGHIMDSLGSQWKPAEKSAGSRRMNSVTFG